MNVPEELELGLTFETVRFVVSDVHLLVLLTSIHAVCFVVAGRDHPAITSGV